MTILERLGALEKINKYLTENPAVAKLIRQGYRYIGNSRNGKLHDLLRVNNNCQIEEIIVAGNAVAFKTHIHAWLSGYTESGFYCNGK